MDVHDSHALTRVRARAAAGLLACAILAACGDGAGRDDPSTLVVGQVGDAIGLDPSHETDGISLNVTSQVFDTLVRFRPGSFDVVPGIATSWSASADGRAWTFVLRPGLRFSDGTPLDAAAVKYNFDRWRLREHPAHGEGGYPYYRSQFGGSPGDVAAVLAPNRTTLTLRLRDPLAPLLRDLAMPSFGIGSPAAIARDPAGFGARPVASGPYAVAEWVRGDHITLQANPRWSGPKPAYRTVIVRAIPDQNTSLLSIQKGDISALANPRPEDVRVLADQANVRVYEQPSNALMYVAMNVGKRPFGDVRVLRAVAYAIDIPSIVRGFYGRGTVVAGNWTPPGMLGENPAVAAYPYDPARAKALLASAGLAAGFPTDLYYPTAPRPYMPDPERLAQAIATDLGAVGIDVRLEPLEFGAFLRAVRSGEHAMCLAGWTGDDGDPDDFTYPLLDADSAVPGSAQNLSFWRDARFHALMLAGRRAVGERRRRAAYMQANAMIHDQVPAVAIVHGTVPLVVSRAVAGVIPRPDSILNFERWKPRT